MTASPSEIESIDKMLRTALMADNDGTRLNAIRLAAQRITKLKLDPHTVGIGKSSGAKGWSDLTSIERSTLDTTMAENRRLREQMNRHAQRDMDCGDALRLEKQTSSRLLEWLTHYLGGPVYTDSLYQDQSNKGGSRRRWDRAAREISRLHAYAKAMEDNRKRLVELEKRYAALREGIETLAGDAKP